MNFPDVRTVIFSQLVTDVLCVFVLALLWQQNRRRFAGSGFWMLDFGFQAAATLLIILRGGIPDWMSTVLSNSLVIAGALLGYIGLERFVGKKSPQVHNYVLLAAFALIHSYFVIIRPNLAARNVNISLGLLIICFQCTWLMLRRVDPGMRRVTYGVGLVFGAFCLVSLVRIADLLAGPQASNDFFQSGTFDTLILVSYQMLLILLAFGLTLMGNRRLLAEIQTQEEKFAKAFRLSPHAIMLSRLSDGRMLEVNESFVNISGYSRAEVIGKTTRDLYLWAREKDRAAVVNELSMGKRVEDSEVQFRNKSGKMLTGLFSAEVMMLDNQSWVVSTISDITERKRTEEALSKSEEKYRMLFREMLDGFALYEILYDEQGNPSDYRFLAVNPAFERMTGMKAQDIVGRTVLEALPGTERYWIETYGKVALTGQPVSFENYSGELKKHFDVTVFQPAPNQLACIFADITERKCSEMALAQEHNLLRTLMDHLPDQVYIKDAECRYVINNPVHLRSLGVTQQAEVLGKTSFDFFPQPLAAQFYATEQAIIRSGQPMIEQEESMRDLPTGQPVWHLTTKVALRDNQGKVFGLLGVSREITERKQAQEVLRESEERFHTLIENVGEGIGLVNPEEQFIFANPASEDIFGVLPGGLLGHNLAEFTTAEQFGVIREQTRGRKVGEKSVYEIEISRPDGEKSSLLITAVPQFDRRGNFMGTFGVFRNFTERKRAEAELLCTKDSLAATNQELQRVLGREQSLARTDPLTGASNRLRVFEFAEHEFQVAARYQRPLSIIMLDIDHFKQVNDTFGHAAGDRVLMMIVRTAQDQLRSPDVLARYGGEEFVALLPATDAKQAGTVAERIRERIAALAVETKKGNVQVTVSIGVATVLPGDASIDRVIQRADDAMYAAKHAGRNRVVTAAEPADDCMRYSDITVAKRSDRPSLDSGKPWDSATIKMGTGPIEKQSHR